MSFLEVHINDNPRLSVNLGDVVEGPSGKFRIMYSEDGFGYSGILKLTLRIEHLHEEFEIK